MPSFRRPHPARLSLLSVLHREEVIRHRKEPSLSLFGTLELQSGAFLLEAGRLIALYMVFADSSSPRVLTSTVWPAESSREASFQAWVH